MTPKVKDNLQTALAKFETALDVRNKKDMEAYTTNQDAIKDLVKNGATAEEAATKVKSSNEVLNFVKQHLVVSAYRQSGTLSHGELVISAKSLRIMTNTLDMFSRIGTRYDNILNSVSVSYDNRFAAWILKYDVNEGAITNSYRRYLNAEHGTELPLEAEDETKEIDNDVMACMHLLDPTTLAMAGV